MFHDAENTGKQDVGDLYNAPVQTPYHSTTKTVDQRTSSSSLTKENGALGLLASAYGDSSDSEEEDHKGLDNPVSDEVACVLEASSFVTDGNDEAGNGLSSALNSQGLTCEKGKEVDVSHANLSKGGNASSVEITLPFIPRSDDDFSRLHVFCLEHAAEVEQRLHPIGGINIMLLCHPGKQTKPQVLRKK